MGLIKEIGLAAGAFTLCAWMVVYTVKRLASSLDTMIAKQETFMNRVRAEHEAFVEQQKEAREDHKEFSKQNQEITATLGRINGYKS